MIDSRELLKELNARIAEHEEVLSEINEYSPDQEYPSACIDSIEVTIGWIERKVEENGDKEQRQG